MNNIIGQFLLGSILIKAVTGALIKRFSWKSALLTGVLSMFFFSGVGLWIYAAGFTAYSWSAYVAGSACLSVVTAGGSEAKYPDFWKFINVSAEEGKRSEVNIWDHESVHTLPGWLTQNHTMHPDSILDAYNTVSSILDDVVGNFTYIAYTEIDKVNNTVGNSQLSKRSDNTTDLLPTIAFVYNSTGRLISTYVHVDSVSAAAWSLKEHLTTGKPSSLSKRSDSAWVSYETYGYDDRYGSILHAQPNNMVNDMIPHIESWGTQQVQPCTQPQCYSYLNKGCLSLGDNPTPGVALGLVGEFYTNQYGGVDSQCDSG